MTVNTYLQNMIDQLREELKPVEGFEYDRKKRELYQQSLQEEY